MYVSLESRNIILAGIKWYSKIYIKPNDPRIFSELNWYTLRRALSVFYPGTFVNYHFNYILFIKKTFQDNHGAVSLSLWTPTNSINNGTTPRNNNNTNTSGKSETFSKTDLSKNTLKVTVVFFFFLTRHYFFRTDI